MCILCEMKAAGANEAVIKLAEMLMEKLIDAMTVHGEIRERSPAMHTAKERDVLQSCADMMTPSPFNGLSVQFVVVAEGETVLDAVTRTLKES